MRRHQIFIVIFFYLNFGNVLLLSLRRTSIRSNANLEKLDAMEDEELAFIRSSAVQNFDAIKAIKDFYDDVEAQTQEKFREKLQKMTDDYDKKLSDMKNWHIDSVAQIKKNHQGDKNENTEKLKNKEIEDLKKFDQNAAEDIESAKKQNNAINNKLDDQHNLDIESLKQKQAKELEALKENCDSEYNLILNENQEKLKELRAQETEEINAKIDLFNKAELNSAAELGISEDKYEAEKRIISEEIYPTHPAGIDISKSDAPQ